MTRFDGYRLLACPLCLKVHAKANIVSFNMMAYENWSDGRSVHSLFDNRKGLRRCTECKDFFLESDAISHGHISSLDARENIISDDVNIPAFLRRDADGKKDITKASEIETKTAQPKSWFSRLKSWWLENPQNEFYRPSRVEGSENSEEHRQLYPRLQNAYDADLVMAIENYHQYSDALIISARHLYWMYLNDSYRDQARDALKNKKDPTSLFNPSEQQINNMVSLLELMENNPNRYQETTLAELHRELGHFDKALSLLEESRFSSKEAETIYNAAVAAIRAPVRIYYSHQK